MAERALEATRRRAADALERGESLDLVAILREEYALEPRASYERAVRAIAETAASAVRRRSDEGEEAIERWAHGVRASGSLYLALGDAIAWLQDNASESGSEARASMLF